MLVMLMGFLAIIIYKETKDDFEEIYGKWKERRRKKKWGPYLKITHKVKAKIMYQEKLFFEFIVAEEKKKNKGCKM